VVSPRPTRTPSGLPEPLDSTSCGRLPGSRPVPPHRHPERSGAKNAALPALAASLLTADPVSIANLPAVADVRTMGILLGGMGVAIERSSTERATLRADRITSTKPRTTWSGRCGPRFSFSGRSSRARRGAGLAAGRLRDRREPVDLHLAGWRRWGRGSPSRRDTSTRTSRGVAGPRTPRGRPDLVSAPDGHRHGERPLRGVPRARTHRIHNAALEPEVVDTARLLSKMGARIEGAGTPTDHGRRGREPRRDGRRAPRRCPRPDPRPAPFSLQARSRGAT